VKPERAPNQLELKDKWELTRTMWGKSLGHALLARDTPH